MKVLLDLNVLLDVLQKREPHYAASADVASRVARGELAGCIAGHAVTTIYYVVARFAGDAEADTALDWLLRDFTILPEDRETFLRARALGFPDFEDAVVAAAAETGRCDRIVTRNVTDFAGSPIPALTPEELRGELAAQASASSEPSAS